MNLNGRPQRRLTLCHWAREDWPVCLNMRELCAVTLMKRLADYMLRLAEQSVVLARVIMHLSKWMRARSVV